MAWDCFIYTLAFTLYIIGGIFGGPLIVRIMGPPNTDVANILSHTTFDIMLFCFRIHCHLNPSWFKLDHSVGPNIWF